MITDSILAPRIDISELVGEMPARVCGCRIEGCNGAKHRSRCDHQATWAVRVHGTSGVEHGNFVLDLCDGCLRSAQEIKASRGNCISCGQSWSMVVVTL